MYDLFFCRVARNTLQKGPQRRVSHRAERKGGRRWGTAPRPSGLSDYAPPAQRGPAAPGGIEMARQRVSCALTRAVATAVAVELSLPMAYDPRGKARGG